VDDSVEFVDCPAYSDKHGTIRCGLPAEVEDRYTMTSTDGPLDSARIRCPRGHWFNGPIEVFSRASEPGLGSSRELQVLTPSLHLITYSSHLDVRQREYRARYRTVLGSLRGGVSCAMNENYCFECGSYTRVDDSTKLCLVCYDCWPGAKRPSDEPAD
jgi:hypothetical protein